MTLLEYPCCFIQTEKVEIGFILDPSHNYLKNLINVELRVLNHKSPVSSRRICYLFRGQSAPYIMMENSRRMNKARSNMLLEVATSSSKIHPQWMIMEVDLKRRISPSEIAHNQKYTFLCNCMRASRKFMLLPWFLLQIRFPKPSVA